MPEHLQCPMCGGVLRDAVLLPCCCASVCDGCAREALDESDKELKGEYTRSKGPNGSPTGECFQLDKREDNETQPVLPTIFMPGFPKSASTWLFECMHTAFVPETVCDDEPSAVAQRRKNMDLTNSRLCLSWTLHQGAI